MYKKAFYSTSMILLVTLAFGLSSCNKGCVIEKEDTDSGLIILDGLVYTTAGGLSESMAGDFHVDGASGYENLFEISLDGGVSKQSVDYGTYSIIGYPMTVQSCEVAFVREVTRDDVLETATYKIRAYVCKDSKCDQDRTVENFILVPAIPASYTVFYDVLEIEG
jgi:hypothetical protein